MEQLVNNFVRLQEFDDKLNSLKLQKGDLPMLIEHLSEELQENQEKANAQGVQIEKLKNDRKMFEKELEASKAQLAKYEDQLYKVQNNKEYDAISLEIDTKKAEIDSLEAKVLQTIEEEENIKQEITSLKESVEDIETQLTENKKELEEINLQTKEEEAVLNDKREKIAKKIDQRYLSQYERIRKAKSGQAVATVNRNSCTGCYSMLPPQRIVEIREGGIHSCEYCGRMLVWVEKNDA